MDRIYESSAHRGARREVHRGKLYDTRILVVEDEAIIALELQSTFRDESAVILGPALTLSRAIALAARENITAAVLDLRLGREPISPVARILSERKIPFLFYSGQPGDDPVLTEWPGRQIIAKPAKALQLVDAVMVLVGRAGSPTRRAIHA